MKFVFAQGDKGLTKKIINNEKRIPTAEFLMKLINSKSFENFYTENIDHLQLPTIRQYLANLFEERNVLSHLLFKEVDIEKSLGHRILTGERRLSRDNAIKIAFGLKLNVEESQRFLTISQNNLLYPFIPRDAALLYCLHNGISYRDVQDKLYEWGITILGDEIKHDKND